MPALVEPIAGKPASSKMRALATSQALGRIRISGCAWSAAKCRAFSDCESNSASTSRQHLGNIVVENEHHDGHQENHAHLQHCFLHLHAQIPAHENLNGQHQNEAAVENGN